MEYIFFYSSIVIILILFFFCVHFRKLSLPHIIIGLTSIGYSMLSDSTFGNVFKLFYYINPQTSNIYMIIAAIFLYPLLNMLYTMFLPEGRRIIYTIYWIIGLLIFEYLSLLTKTVVFTGWKMFPWSIVLYVVSYLWIYYLYIYLKTRIPVNQNR